ncbi:hypothetical protein ACFW9F_09880 [Streptomyces sp. NPDC059506]|uniref:hypothetical protein n=1 Tax=Streptomyces sp. NPDC059506 TaxID=3347751 RepID=UPI0036C5BD4D
MTEERVRVRARELYRMALADAAWTPSRIRVRTGWSAEELEQALQRLARLGLVTPFDEAPSGWSVLSPATAMAHLVESSERRTEELVEAVSRSRAALAEVAGDYQAVHTEQFAAQQVEVAVHPAQVAAILEEAAQRAGSEILSLHPGRPFSPAQLLAGDERNREAINRGVTMRSIHLAGAGAARPPLPAPRWGRGPPPHRPPPPPPPTPPPPPPRPPPPPPPTCAPTCGSSCRAGPRCAPRPPCRCG